MQKRAFSLLDTWRLAGKLQRNSMHFVADLDVSFGDKSTQQLKGFICRISIACLIGNIYHANTDVQQS
jgi:hypothetical protein